MIHRRRRRASTLGQLAMDRALPCVRVALQAATDRPLSASAWDGMRSVRGSRRRRRRRTRGTRHGRTELDMLGANIREQAVHLPGSSPRAQGDRKASVSRRLLKFPPVACKVRYGQYPLGRSIASRQIAWSLMCWRGYLGGVVTIHCIKALVDGVASHQRTFRGCRSLSLALGTHRA